MSDKRECINLPGLMQYEIEMNRRIMSQSGMMITEVVEKYSSSERWRYCSFNCPVQQRCKFESKYRDSQKKPIATGLNSRVDL